MGQGERIFYPDAEGRLTRLRSADDEHSVPGKQMLLAGDMATRLQLWDAVRSLDYLASHPLADPKRLGSTGQSGGGTLTMLLACVDDRLAAAAVCCGNTENFACRDFHPPGATDDAEQNLIESGPAGFDRWDLLYPMAPKPLLVAVSARDFFGTYSPAYLEDGREEFGKLRRAYALLGAEDCVRWYETPLPHALSYELRLEVYNWFLRWLGDGRQIAVEPPVEAEADATLWVGPTGNVVRDFHSATPFVLNRHRVAQMRPAGPPAPLPSWPRLDLPASPELTELGRSALGNVTVEACEVRSSESVWSPVWLFLPAARERTRSLAVIVEPQGRNARWREGKLYRRVRCGRATPSSAAMPAGAKESCTLAWPSEVSRCAPPMCALSATWRRSSAAAIRLMRGRIRAKSTTPGHRLSWASLCSASG
ncbi:MAG: acetylxylan esterase [Bryobacterales bacterium]|nr:acetylxylan esterase [Bryobacterales bacterium]